MSLKRACLSLNRQALTGMRLKSLATCPPVVPEIRRLMEIGQEVTCYDASWHPSAGSAHKLKLSRFVRKIDIS